MIHSRPSVARAPPRPLNGLTLCPGVTSHSVLSRAHVSELAAEPPRDPGDLFAVGDVVRAKVLRIDTDERKIGLSVKSGCLNRSTSARHDQWA